MASGSTGADRVDHVSEEPRKKRRLNGKSNASKCKASGYDHEPPWITHLLKMLNEGIMEEDDIMNFLRIEFQDGSRKDPTQDYHGSGRPHLHGVVWISDLRKARLHEKISVSMPSKDNSPEMHAYVKSGQLDQSHWSPWPVVETPSEWNEEKQCYDLHHTHGDRRSGLRAFFIILMEALKGCHQERPLSAVHMCSHCCASNS